MAGMTGRVVKVRQLTITEVNEIQLLANRTAGEQGEDGLRLELLAQVVANAEALEGVKRMLAGVTALPVDIVDPPPPESADEMPHQMLDGRIRILRAGPDGMANLKPGDWVPLVLKDLEFPGPKQLDELFDVREYSLLTNAYRSLHGAPVRVVQEMLAGKLNPVVMEG